MTPFVSDTFTDADGTLLQDHAPEVGGAWVRHYGFSDLNFVIEGNQAERNSYASDDFTVVWNENLAVAPSADVSVAVDLEVTGGVESNYLTILLYARGNGVDSICAEFFLQGADSYVSVGMASTNGDNVLLTPTLTHAGQTQTLKMTLEGQVATLFVDDVEVHQVTLSGAFSDRGTAGFAIGQLDGGYDLTDFHLNNFLALGTPGPFWTGLVACEETP